LQEEEYPDRRANHESPLDVGRNGGDTATTQVGRHVDSARYGIPMDDGGRRHDTKVGHVLQAYVATRGCVDQEILYTREAMASVWRAQHHHIEHFLLLEQVADFDPRYQ
jgi:hypothetical protein